MRFRMILLIFILALSACKAKNEKTGFLTLKPTPEEITRQPCKYNGKILLATSSGINVTDSTFSDFSHTITTAEGLPNNLVRHLHLHNDVLFAATPAGLVSFKDDCSLIIDKVLTTSHGLPSNDVKKILTAPDSSLWVVTASGIARSYDGGESFNTFIGPSTPGMAGANFLSDQYNYGNVILFAKDNPSIILIGFNNTLCRSVDAGASFACSQPSSIVKHWYGDWVTGLVQLNGGVIVMSTGRGILRSTDEGATWSPGTGLNNLWCNGLNHNPKTDALFVSTAGFSSYSSAGDGTGFSNYGAGSWGAWNTFPLPNGQVLIATVGAGLFVAQSEATITTTTAFTTTNGLLNNHIFWISYLP